MYCALQGDSVDEILNIPLISFNTLLGNANGMIPTTRSFVIFPGGNTKIIRSATTNENSEHGGGKQTPGSLLFYSVWRLYSLTA